MGDSRLCSKESEKLTRNFVDNWSHYISLAEYGYEKECLQLIDLLENTRLNWKNSVAEAQVYKDKVQTLESRLKVAETKINELDDRLVHTQAEMSALVTKKRAIETELGAYKTRFEQARGILRDQKNLDIDYVKSILNTSVNSPQKSPYVAHSSDNTTTVSGSVLEPMNVTTRRRHLSPIFPEEDHSGADFSATSNSDIDYDKTNDSIESYTESNRRSSRKRRSRSQVHVSRAIRFEDDPVTVRPSKRSKSEHEDDTVAPRVPEPHPIRRSMNRSMSESTLNDFPKPSPSTKTKPFTPSGLSTVDLRSPSAIASSWTNGQQIERRTHRVVSISPLWEFCDICAKRFALRAQNALRCVDCQIKFHRHCHSRAPMPCIPRVMYPKSGTKQKAPLKAYCPSSHPMIPPILIHCIVALERDRLTFEGIYRVPGSEISIAKLYNEFLYNRLVPSFTAVETETITGVIKKFLRDLRDSLIPTLSFDDFKTAAESMDDQALVKAVLDLPAANRDTLAYFLSHLQNVAKHSGHNLMPIENLARCLCPTIVGYSTFVTAAIDHSEAITNHQYRILYRLLKIPQDFWRQFVDKNMTYVLYQESKTPGSKKEFLTPKSTCSEPKRLRDRFAEGCAQQESSPLIQPITIGVRKAPIFQDPLL